VPPTPAQQAQATRIAREIAALGFALPGCLTAGTRDERFEFGLDCPLDGVTARLP
jgi:hypothetical protein